MKNTSKTYYYLIAALLLISLESSRAHAEKVKVKKIKGTQAVIETITPLEEGQTYELVTESVSQDVNYKTNVFSSRINSLTLGAQFDFLKTDAYQSNSFSFQGRYGWNFSNLEVGIIADVSSKDLGAGATTTFLGGGYFDYNFVPNRDPKKIIYGGFALLGIGTTSYPSGSTSGGSSTVLQTNLGGFFSYFIGTTSTALRGELSGIYQQVNTTALQSTLLGIGARGLLIFYF